MKTIYSLLIVLIFFSSCYVSKPTQTLLPPSLYSNMKYIPRPLLEDSVKSKMYVSANYQSFDRDEDYVITKATEIAFARGHSFKKFQFGYGVSYTSGKAKYENYDTSGKFLRTESNRFSSLLVQGSFNGVIVRKNIEFRYLSLDMGYSKEMGNYKKTREALIGEQFYITVINTTIYTMGLSTEIASKSDGFGWALRLGFARNIGNFFYVDNSSVVIKNAVYPYLSGHLNYKHFFFTAEGSEATGRLGLGYSF